MTDEILYPYESTNLYELTKDDETTDEILNPVQDDKPKHSGRRAVIEAFLYFCIIS